MRKNGFKSVMAKLLVMAMVLSNLAFCNITIAFAGEDTNPNTRPITVSELKGFRDGNGGDVTEDANPVVGRDSEIKYTTTPSAYEDIVFIYNAKNGCNYASYAAATAQGENETTQSYANNGFASMKVNPGSNLSSVNNFMYVGYQEYDSVVVGKKILCIFLAAQYKLVIKTNGGEINNNPIDRNWTANTDKTEYTSEYYFGEALTEDSLPSDGELVGAYVLNSTITKDKALVRGRQFKIGIAPKYAADNTTIINGYDKEKDDFGWEVDKYETDANGVALRDVDNCAKPDTDCSGTITFTAHWSKHITVWDRQKSADGTNNANTFDECTKDINNIATDDLIGYIVIPFDRDIESTITVDDMVRNYVKKDKVTNKVIESFLPGEGTLLLNTDELTFDQYMMRIADPVADDPTTTANEKAAGVYAPIVKLGENKDQKYLVKDIDGTIDLYAQYNVDIFVRKSAAYKIEIDRNVENSAFTKTETDDYVKYTKVFNKTDKSPKVTITYVDGFDQNEEFKYYYRESSKYFTLSSETLMISNYAAYKADMANVAPIYEYMINKDAVLADTTHQIAPIWEPISNTADDTKIYKKLSYPVIRLANYTYATPSDRANFNNYNATEIDKDNAKMLRYVSCVNGSKFEADTNANVSKSVLLGTNATIFGPDEVNGDRYVAYFETNDDVRFTEEYFVNPISSKEFYEEDSIFKDLQNKKIEGTDKLQYKADLAGNMVDMATGRYVLDLRYLTLPTIKTEEALLTKDHATFLGWRTDADADFDWSRAKDNEDLKKMVFSKYVKLLRRTEYTSSDFDLKLNISKNDTNIHYDIDSVASVQHYYATYAQDLIDISTAEVTLDAANLTFNRQKQEPFATEVKLTLGEGDKAHEITLIYRKDFYVTYDNNFNATTATSKATATIHGIGAFTGTVTKEFEIAQLDITNKSKVLTIASRSYTGEAIAPHAEDITVESIGYILRDSKDYDFTYADNTNIGLAKVNIVAKGNYKGTVQGHFAITNKVISKDMITVDTSDVIYNGKEIKPAVTVTNTVNGTTTKQTLIEGENKDFLLEYKNNLDVGTATIKVTGIGNYAGTETYTFDIVQKDLTKVIKFKSIPDQVFTGKEITFEDIKTYLEDANTEDALAITDATYDVIYTKNVHTGTATIILDGHANFMNEVVTTFKIVPADFVATIGDVIDYTYTGNPIEPTAVVSTKSLLYDVTYSNNIDATDEAVMTITNKDPNFKLTSVTKKFKIKKAQFAAEIAMIETQTYADGVEVKPQITVVNPVTKNYTVTYANNINAGLAKATLTSTDKNYEGSVSQMFFIRPAEFKATVDAIPNLTYNGKAQEPAIKVTTKAKSYKANYYDNVNAGSGYVILESTDPNYMAPYGKIGQIFTIDPAKFTAKVSVANQTYTGNELTPSVKVTTDARNYKVDYSDNTNAGKATVTVTACDRNYTGSVTANFTIKQAKFKMSMCMINNQWYTGKAITPKSYVSGARCDYKVTYKNNVKVGTATAIFTPTDKNFTGTVTQNFKIVAPVEYTFSVGSYKYAVTTASGYGIGNVAVVGFSGKALDNVTIGNTVSYAGFTFNITSIKAKAFKNNSTIKSVTIGNKIHTISTEAFYGCKNLSKVTIGTAVKNLNAKSFAYTGLGTVIANSNKIGFVGKSAFAGIKKLTVDASSSKISKYKSLFSGKGVSEKLTVK